MSKERELLKLCAEAALEQALKDSIDTEKLMQILKDGGILIEVGGGE